MKIQIAGILIIIFLLSCDEAKYPYFIRNEGGDHYALWVSISSHNRVTHINRYNNRIVGTYTVGSDPSRTAVDASGNCWVGDRGDGSVWNVDIKGNTAQYTGFSAARGVALDRSGNVWVASSGDGTMKKITRNSDGSFTVSADSVTLGGYLYGAIVDKSNNFWAADNTSGAYRLHKYDLSKWPDPAGLTTYPFGVSGYGFTIDPKGKIWVGGYGNATLIKFDPVNGVIENTYSTNSIAPTGVTFDANGNIWGGNVSGNQVICFNPVTETFETVTISGAQPHGVGADDAGFVYTINLGSGTVSKININTKKEVYTYNVGGNPYMYSDFTGFIYRKITLGK